MRYQEFKRFCTEYLLNWGLHSDAVVELLCMIAAHESHGCKYRRQLIMKNSQLVPEGAARGPWGMEPPTHNSVWDNSDTINARASKFGITRSDPDRMIDDDVYALWMARHYIAMDRNPLPKTPEAMAQYCKDYWNRTGAATPEKYLNDWQLWKDGKL